MYALINLFARCRAFDAASEDGPDNVVTAMGVTEDIASDQSAGVPGTMNLAGQEVTPEVEGEAANPGWATGGWVIGRVSMVMLSAHTLKPCLILTRAFSVCLQKKDPTDTELKVEPPSQLPKPALGGPADPVEWPTTPPPNIPTTTPQVCFRWC
jgi:hypothetical protein